jgi:hypothetical protein
VIQEKTQWTTHSLTDRHLAETLTTKELAVLSVSLLHSILDMADCYHALNFSSFWGVGSEIACCELEDGPEDPEEEKARLKVFLAKIIDSI